ncbi:MAG: NAD(P)-dependent oxidoreductase, partial [Bacteroidota bacterium]
MAKIIFVDKAAHPYLGEALKKTGHDWEDHADKSREEVLRLLPQFDGLMVRSRLKIDRELMDAHPNLQFVARWGVGTEHIDLDYAKLRGIAVFNSPEGSRHTVAEHTVGMMLMLLNHLGRADQQIRMGKWIRRANTGKELGHLTVGLIGYGNMGKATARRLSGFGCRVVVHDKYLTNYGDEYAEAVSLTELQKVADVLSLHIILEGKYHYVNHHR